MIASARRPFGPRRRRGRQQFEAERLVARLLEGSEQPVDLDRPGRSQCFGQSVELVARELCPCQDVGGGGPVGRRFGRGSLPSRNAKRRLSGLTRPPGTAASASSRSSSGFLASAAIRSKRAGSSPALSSASGRLSGRHGEWNERRRRRDLFEHARRGHEPS